MINKLSFADLCELQQATSSSRALRIVKFYSNGCPMCHTFKPMYVDIAAAYPDVEFYVFNIDMVGPDWESLFPMVKGVPTLCTLSSHGVLAALPDPDPPNDETWYNASFITQFIDKEKNK
jgi:thiol-disulfide isomerase/thioredoxin